MMIATYTLWVFLLIGIPAHITAYKSGAPETACELMIPDHHSTPQTEPSPYTITPDKFKVKAGDYINVIISGSDSTKFRGYLIQARVGKTPIGSFLKGPEIKLLNCGSGVENAATHIDNKDKGSVQLTWKSPAGLSESVRFRVTFVKTGAEYWVGQESDPITVQ